MTTIMENWHSGKTPNHMYMKSEERNCHVAAVHHDHIPCAKPLDYGFDHMYTAFKSRPRDRAIEAQHLKELCLLQVDLIEKQEKELVAKDKQLKELTLQVETYKKRLNEKTSPTSCQEKKRSASHLEEPPTVSEPEKADSGSRKATSSSKKLKDSDETPKYFKRKQRVVPDPKTPGSSSSVCVPDDFSVRISYDTWLKEAREKCHVKGTEKDLLACRAQQVVLSDCPPSVSKGPTFIEVLNGKSQSQQKEVPVPAWREHKVVPLYQMEGTEDIEEDTFNKRHQKHETMEKRRKRWDLQRLREESQIEKLQGRDRKADAGKAKKEPKKVMTFHPDAEEIRYIEIADKCPVSALGTSVPELPQSYMKLSRSSKNKKD